MANKPFQATVRLRFTPISMTITKKTVTSAGKNDGEDLDFRTLGDVK